MARGAALVAYIFAASAPAACGHGRMTFPVARNGDVNGAVGGGPANVHAFNVHGEHTKYHHGLCGNAFGVPQIYNQVGEATGHFVAGRPAELKAVITAHHMGFFEFELCDDAGQISEECFAKHRLLRHGCTCSCHNDPSNSCLDCQKCRRWWKPALEGELGTSYTENYPGPNLPGDGNTVPYEFTMFYWMPATVKTTRGVLRWHYMTTNSCTSHASAPEEFWNCADVTVGTTTGDNGPERTYDNEFLKKLQPVNLMPAITEGFLVGVNDRCPMDEAGNLKTVGVSTEYSCGTLANGEMLYCMDLTDRGQGEFDQFCQSGNPASGVICTAPCSSWWVSCQETKAHLQPVPAGTKCKDGAFILQGQCVGQEPTPSPAPTPAPAPTPPPAPTPAPTLQCIPNTDCKENPWCDDSSLVHHCEAEGSLGACRKPQCVWSTERYHVTRRIGGSYVEEEAKRVKQHGRKVRRRLRVRREQDHEDTSMLQAGMRMGRPAAEEEEEFEYVDEEEGSTDDVTGSLFDEL